MRKYYNAYSVLPWKRPAICWCLWVSEGLQLVSYCEVVEGRLWESRPQGLTLDVGTWDSQHTEAAGKYSRLFRGSVQLHAVFCRWKCAEANVMVTVCLHCSLVFMSSIGIKLHFATSRVYREVVSPFSVKGLSLYLDFDMYVLLSWLLILNIFSEAGSKMCLSSSSTWQGYLFIINQYKHLSDEYW